MSVIERSRFLVATICAAMLAALLTIAMTQPGQASTKSDDSPEAPVEVMSERTETSQTFENPDGTTTLKEYAAPVCLRQDGEWVDVDYTLVEQSDGSYAPKAAPEDVRVSGGETKEAARVDFGDDQSMSVSWPQELPKPSIDGGVATYKISEATDLLVAVTGSGIATRIRLNEQPSADDPVYRLGLQTDGADLKQTAQGGLAVTDDETNKAIGSTSTLVAWDSKTDRAGEPAEIVPVDAELDQTSSAGDVSKHTLDLTAPDGYLADPDTEYPVIIDPDLNAVTHIRDTWVRSGTTENQGASYRLLVGRLGGSENTNPIQAYTQWSNTQIAGKPIISAEMGLFQYEPAPASRAP